MPYMDKAMVPRGGLRIDITLHELPFPYVGLGGAVLGVRAGTSALVVAGLALLVSIRVRISLI
ncbi:hypothetical protein [Streptomyces sp. NBC_00268]|uniref:hypothetical protein n=1 Tax=Streptomyces sp. NBC_00268 TaxID=2975695 RepID=UPI002257B3C8|nr:hypothetical protein [Streptomyces sp. NBC_00268]MCX5185530.1 hypothetical protein [Streptomyces sp. NBC_00268]